ncbi:MAG: hypothetical protein ACRDHW_15585, partial [Ktedonobacteraceae bacterium]
MIWGNFLAESVKQLAGYIVAGSRDTARKLADLILAEQQIARHGQDNTGRIAELEAEIKHLQTRMDKQYVKKSVSKADAQELEQARADLRRLYQERAREQEQHHQLYETCCSQRMHLETAQQKIKDLENQARRPVKKQQCAELVEQGKQEIRDLYKVSITRAEKERDDMQEQLEQARRGTNQLQERYRQYVAMTNEKLAALASELARYRQEEEQRSEIRAQYQTPEPVGPRCSTAFDGAIIDRHTPKERNPGQYDVLGHYWCADCLEACQCMANGSELGWPEVNYWPYNPPGKRTLMVRAGAENWYEYLQIRGKKAHH